MASNTNNTPAVDTSVRDSQLDQQKKWDWYTNKSISDHDKCQEANILWQILSGKNNMCYRIGKRTWDCDITRFQLIKLIDDFNECHKTEAIPGQP
jgi:hypothetical protein